MLGKKFKTNKQAVGARLKLIEEGQEDIVVVPVDTLGGHTDYMVVQEFGGKNILTAPYYKDNHALVVLKAVARHDSPKILTARLNGMNYEFDKSCYSYRYTEDGFVLIMAELLRFRSRKNFPQGLLPT